MKVRSGPGIILTILGVVLVVASLTTDWWFAGARKGFHEWQLVGVILGVVLLATGWLLCARCRCRGAAPTGTCAAAPPAGERKPEPPAA